MCTAALSDVACCSGAQIVAAHLAAEAFPIGLAVEPDMAVDTVHLGQCELHLGDDCIVIADARAHKRRHILRVSQDQI